MVALRYLNDLAKEWWPLLLSVSLTIKLLTFLYGLFNG